MLKLSKALKDEVMVMDEVIALDLSFDKVLRVLEMLRDDSVDEWIKVYVGLEILTNVDFVGRLDIQTACDVFVDILNSHIMQSEPLTPEYDLMGNLLPIMVDEQEKEAPLYDFVYDGEYIYSSFMQAYGIDLFEVQGVLHWRKFNALLCGLPDNTKLMEVMRIRSWKPSKGDSSEYKEKMRKLQREYELPEK